jgi:hypothetical protein
MPQPPTINVGDKVDKIVTYYIILLSTISDLAPPPFKVLILQSSEF